MKSPADRCSQRRLSGPGRGHLGPAEWIFFNAFEEDDDGGDDDDDDGDEMMMMMVMVMIMMMSMMVKHLSRILSLGTYNVDFTIKI